VFEVNGAKQETMEMTSTYAKFKITDIKGLVLRNMNLYFEVGNPEGFKTVIQNKTLTLSPKLGVFSPNIGSVGGTIIRANVQGIGPLSNTSESYFAANGATLVDNSTGANLCE
jgi:hypothetical protein